MISRPSRRSDSTSAKGRHDPRTRGTPHAASQRLQPVQQVVGVLAVRARVERHDDGLLDLLVIAGRPGGSYPGLQHTQHQAFDVCGSNGPLSRAAARPSRKIAAVDSVAPSWRSHP